MVDYVDFVFVCVRTSWARCTDEGEVDFYTRVFLGYVPREVRTRPPLVEVSKREKVIQIPVSIMYTLEHRADQQESSGYRQASIILHVYTRIQGFRQAWKYLSFFLVGGAIPIYPPLTWPQSLDYSDLEEFCGLYNKQINTTIEH